MAALQKQLKNLAALIALSAASSSAAAAESSTATKPDASSPTSAKLPQAGVALENSHVPVGWLPVSWIQASLKENLSPKGQSRFVTINGPLRVTDLPENLEKASKALAELQKSPALVNLSFKFTSTEREEVQRYPQNPPVVSYGVPYPQRYEPARIIQNGNGFTIIPPRPTDFVTHDYGPGIRVNPTGLGYLTSEQVRMTETRDKVSVISTATMMPMLGKFAIHTMQAQVQDLGSLRDLALKTKAIEPNEPAWTRASTELAFVPGISQNGSTLVVRVIPMIAIPSADPAIPKRIALKSYEYSFNFERSQRTAAVHPIDADFVRIFLGNKTAGDKAQFLFNLNAGVSYGGSYPKAESQKK